ncbi:protein shisa-5 isoform X1 [Oncorhynchus keta]|uniref:protein shisa-5 isoform X1 n=1 Tax=Oncorhynchus keta TaxID=8018 RepID=UPI00227C232B|nr:protein shisa-5 isoform X1 [Oncorhynchus keta]XP_052330222.1 protein shisa-5 isoform X1 [Oncorhynchus keta]XP_052330223.1 protein shisa-5 isoform X1 [Oncorhynchus keta]XP_052330224.1 protein shisa-5 isoform X1 [Oncorhynchus keta]XP_052330225.1 protein shisa-5 isoform X1 [Oncorhynchus keta]
MAESLCVAVLLLCGTLIPFVTAGNDCEGYFDAKSLYQSKQYCGILQGCCGTCENRYCCSNVYKQMGTSEQNSCFFSSSISSSSFTIWPFIAIPVILVIIIISCCCCPCCCMYNMCRKPRPVIATTSHTTVVNTQFTQQPQQPVQPYQGGPQYPAYQPVPVQPGYGAQPQPGYGGGQPMTTALGYQGQPFQPGPPPPYQETGSAYPPAIQVPYSQAGFSPGQPSYPFQPPAQPGYPAQQPGYPAQQPSHPAQAGAPPAQPDFLSAQPAYNPAFVDSQPPKTGY